MGVDVDEVGSMRMVAAADVGCNKVEIERRSNKKVGGCPHHHHQQQNIYCK